MGKPNFPGNLDQCMNSKNSNSGPFLSGREKIEKDAKNKKPGKSNLMVRKATANNLQSIDVSFPLGLLSVVCGVSGSGKSSLVNEVLAKSAAYELHRSKQLLKPTEELTGLDQFDQVVRVDQSPIGKRVPDPILLPSS